MFMESSFSWSHRVKNDDFTWKIIIIFKIAGATKSTLTPCSWSCHISETPM